MVWQRRVTLLLPLSLLIISLLSACGSLSVGGSSPGQSSSGVVSVVAKENFYGNIIHQLGGSHVSVTSILSDPNVDPHEYQSNVQTGITVSQANLLIENGGGYD